MFVNGFDKQLECEPMLSECALSHLGVACLRQGCGITMLLFLPPTQKHLPTTLTQINNCRRQFCFL